MLNTKLILVDGITGSGKSTSAHFIARQLEKNGISAKWLYEEEKDHPLSLVFDIEDIKEFLENFLKQLIIFVNEINNNDVVYVVESFIFQAILQKSLLEDCNKKLFNEFYQHYCSIIAKLNPVVILFYQNDAEFAMRENWERRSNLWKNFMVSRIENSKFCKNRNLTGEKAYFVFWQEMADITIDFFNGFEFKKILIENSAHDWDNYRKQILDYLEIKLVEEKLFDPTFAQYCGFYLGIEIHIKDNRLYADWGVNYKLLPLNDDVFQFETMPIDLKFIRDKNQKISSLKIVNNLCYGSKEGEEWCKFIPILLEQNEMNVYCGEYYCESKKLDRTIYLKGDSLYFWRNESNSEAKLIPVGNNKFFIHSTRMSIKFEFTGANKKFTFVTPNQEDILFVATKNSCPSHNPINHSSDN